MAQQHINVGTTANDGTGDSLRVSQQKAENNFNELYGMAIVGDAPSDGNTYGRKNGSWDVVTGGGGGSQDLQDVTDIGATTSNDIIANSFGCGNDIFTIKDAGGFNQYQFDTGYNVLFDKIKLTAQRGYSFPDNDGTITTEEWVGLQGFITNVISALGFTPENSANKSTSTADSGSSTKFPVWSAIISYFSASQIRSILGITTLSGSNTGDQDLSGLVVKNSAITGATKTKVTYDSKGLVTSGTDANTDDIQESGTPTNKYFTNARSLASVLTGLSATSGTFVATDTFLTAFGKIKYLIDNIATSSVAGIMKLYTATGSNTDGTMTQKAISDALDTKFDTTGDIQYRLKGYTLYNDFNSTLTNGVFQIVSLASGTVGAINSILDNNHLGILNVSSSTSANSGSFIGQQNSSTSLSTILKQGNRCDIVFSTPSSINSSTLIRFGIATGSVNQTDFTYGTYFEILGDQLVGKTANNSVRSSTSAYTLSASTWYHLRVIVTSTSSIAYAVYDMSGNVLFSANLTTNIPPTNVAMDCKCILTNSGTIAVSLAYVDYISFTIGSMQRGSLN